MENLLKKGLPLLAIVLVMMTSACKKEKKDSITAPTAAHGQYSSVNDFFSKNSVQSQYFTMDASNGATIVGAKGSRITFPAHALVDKSGNPVTGNVKIELKEILKVKDMLLSGVLPVSNGAPLMSGGEIFIKVTKDNGGSQRLATADSIAPVAQDSIVIPNGAELVLADNTLIQVQIPADTLINTMQLFQGDIYNSSINWTVMAHAQWWTGSISDFESPFKSYFFTCHQLNWINVDSFMDGVNTNTQCGLNCTLPEGMENNDTKLYVYYNGINSIFPFFGGSNTTGYSTYEVVNGMEVTIIGISTNSNGQLYSCFMPVKVVAGETVTLVFNECTGDEFKQKMDALQ